MAVTIYFVAGFAFFNQFLLYFTSKCKNTMFFKFCIISAYSWELQVFLHNILVIEKLRFQELKVIFIVFKLLYFRSVCGKNTKFLVKRLR